MTTLDPMNRTLAEHLGRTPHLSPLLRKTRRLGLTTPRQLLDLAAGRGCFHYAISPGDLAPTLDPGRDVLSDVELVIALCSAAQTYDPMLVRCGAQLLGAPGIAPVEVARLARMEHCAVVIRHIATAAMEADDGHEDFWRALLGLLPDRDAPPRAGVLPHRSRFMVQTGIGDPRRPRARQQWLRPTVSCP